MFYEECVSSSRSVESVSFTHLQSPSEYLTNPYKSKNHKCTEKFPLHSMLLAFQATSMYRLRCFLLFFSSLEYVEDFYLGEGPRLQRLLEKHADGKGNWVRIYHCLGCRSVEHLQPVLKIFILQGVVCSAGCGNC